MSETKICVLCVHSNLERQCLLCDYETDISKLTALATAAYDAPQLSKQLMLNRALWDKERDTWKAISNAIYDLEDYGVR